MSGGAVDIGGAVGNVIENILGVNDNEGSEDPVVVPQPPAQTNEPSYSSVSLSAWEPQSVGLPIVYGTRKLPGVLILKETSTNGLILFQYFALCEGTVQSISVFKDTNHALVYNAYSEWAYFLGADGGAQASLPKHGVTGADIDWFNTPPNWGTSQMMKGVAGVFVKFVYHQTEMPRVPSTYFMVTGKNITGNDDNPIRIAYDYLTSTRYGAGISSSLIDSTSLTNAANICDVVSDSVKAFTCNIVLDSRQKVLSNLKQILQTCLGQLHFINGKYYFHIDDTFSGTPVLAIDESMILGGINITADSKNSRANQVIVTWTNPDDQYETSEAAWPDPNDETSTYNAYLTADNNLPLINRVSIPACCNYKQARYLAMILCRTSRQNTKVTLNVTSEGANCVPGDVVTLTYGTMSWSAKEFRVTNVGISASGGINLTMREHFDSFYSRDSATAPSAPANVTIRDPSVIAAVSNLAAAETLYYTREGAGVKSKVTLTWTDIGDTFLSAYEVSYKLSSASIYEPIGDTIQPSIEVFDVGVGTFDFRVISRAIEGALSSASTVTITTTGLGAQPAIIENFFANSMGTVALAQWDVSTDIDVQQGGYYIVAHSVNSAASTWDECVELSPRVAGNQTSVIVPLLAGAYAIRATDSSGQKGLPTFFQSDGTSLTPLSIIQTITEDTAFSGTKNHVEAPDGILKITSVNDMDDISDVDAVTMWDAFGGIYNTSSDGYSSDPPMYTFANYFTLGSSQRVRLRRYIKSFVSEWNDLFDSRATNIDTWTDFDGTDASKTTVTMQLRSTTDDPSSGSASWGEWNDFYVNELTCRGAQFRIFPETTDQYYNLNISELRVYAEQLS